MNSVQLLKAQNNSVSKVLINSSKTETTQELFNRINIYLEKTSSINQPTNQPTKSSLKSTFIKNKGLFINWFK